MQAGMKGWMILNKIMLHCQLQKYTPLQCCNLSQLPLQKYENIVTTRVLVSEQSLRDTFILLFAMMIQAHNAYLLDLNYESTKNFLTAI
jgi:hypothetical protein